MTEQMISEAFTVTDTRQRGWLSESEARSLLETAIFSRRADKKQLVDTCLREMVAAAQGHDFQELQARPTSCEESRIPQLAFVNAVTPKVAAPGSAEEVQASFSALGANGDDLSRDAFVENATAGDSFVVDRAAEGAWRVVSGSSGQPMDYNQYRSNINDVIHSNKIDAKA